MKLQTTLIISFLLTAYIIEAQENEKLAHQKAMEAIELMNIGKYDESIKLLKESEKLDSKNFNYPYEIALAYTYQKEYEKAIKILKKVLKYEGINSQVFQLLGNNYSMSGNKEEALKTYDKGLEKFPNSGNLYLEKGNIYLMDEDYNMAINNYEKGVDMHPEYPSNYYRLAKLFLSSSDKVAGLIYGEIFMNLERTTERTKEMSELLFNAYNNSIQLSKDSSRIDFCEIIIDANSISGGEIKLPFCAIFGKNFILSLLGQEEVNLKSLSEMRTDFIKYFFEEDSKNYPIVLFDYHKKMIEAGVFDGYNHYLFQISNQTEFDEWQLKNEEEYEKFVEWYTTVENYFTINKKNKYLRN